MVLPVSSSHTLVLKDHHPQQQGLRPPILRDLLHNDYLKDHHPQQQGLRHVGRDI